MYGIMRVEKRQKSVVYDLQREANRTLEEHLKGKEFKKSGIDWELTSENIYLVHTKSWKTEISKKIKQVKAETGKTTRKDAVVLLDCIFTASPEFFITKNKDEHKKYFEDCLEFYSKEFCQGDSARIINAVIHLDEKTPHMHVASIPLLTSEKGTTFNAKVIMGNKIEYHKRQDRFFEQVSSKYGLERGEVLPDEEVKAHTSKGEWLIAKQEEEIKRNKEIIKQQSSDYHKLKSELESTEKELQKVDKDLKVKNEQVEQIADIADKMKVKKASDIIRKDTVTVDRATYDSVVAATSNIEQKLSRINEIENFGTKIKELENTKTELKNTKAELESVRDQYESMRRFIDDGQSTLDIRLENAELRKKVKTLSDENSLLLSLLHTAEELLRTISKFAEEHTKLIPEPIRKGINFLLERFTAHESHSDINIEH